MSDVDLFGLRRCVLGVSVLADLDVEPGDDDVLLPGAHPVRVSWSDIGAAVGDWPPDGGCARRRVEELFRLHALVVEYGPLAEARLRRAARLVALPAGHVDLPGPGWSRQALLGGALQLGIGVSGLVGGPDRIASLPLSVLRVLGVQPRDWWGQLRGHADRMGALAAARLRREGPTDRVIRPVGGCDVLALLTSGVFRRQLADGAAQGLQTLAVPNRRRGWYDLTRIDPAFVAAAWSATDEFDRGVPRPLLVTRDEVVLAGDGNPLVGSLG